MPASVCHRKNASNLTCCIVVLRGFLIHFNLEIEHSSDPFGTINVKNTSMVMPAIDKLHSILYNYAKALKITSMQNKWYNTKQLL